MTVSNRVMNIDLLAVRPLTNSVDGPTFCRLCCKHAANLVVDVAAAGLEHRRTASSPAVPRSDQHSSAPRLQPTTARRPRPHLRDYAVLGARQPAQSLRRRGTVVGRQSTGVFRSDWWRRRVSGTDVTTRHVTTLYAVQRQLLRDRYTTVYTKWTEVLHIRSTIVMPLAWFPVLKICEKCIGVRVTNILGLR